MLAPLAALVLAMTSQPQIYVALGDSTGVGVGARRGGGYPARLVDRLSAEGRPLRLVNACVSGARVADVLEGQLPAALAAVPALVTLGIGINDVTHGTDLARFATDYARVAEALARTRARVVVVNVPDLALSPLAQGEEMRRQIRHRIALVNGVIEAAARRNGFALVDLYAATERELAADGARLLSEDQFHPSDAGYERWTDLVQPVALRALGGRPPPALPSGPALR